MVTCAKPKWCNTCEIKGNCKLIDCKKGCDCKKNHYRNDKGICIPEKDCPRPHEECDDGEEYKKCGPACQETCDNYKKKSACTARCVKGCFCKRGLVRSKEGKCISPKHCPKEETCPKYEEYKECVNPCSACKYTIEPCIITAPCRPGCDCIKDYYKNDHGTCVPKHKCPKEETCSKYEEYKECVNPCSACKYAIEPCNIKATCTPGCDCIKDYYKNDHGTCVPKHKCPKDNVCPKNEKETDCATPCTSCKYADRPCHLKIGCRRGCDCIKGYYRNSKGKCVRKNQCENDVCDDDEEYDDCGTACPRTCENYKQKPPCTDQCVAGCFCKDGLVRSKDGKCISPKDCPKNVVCPKNEEETDCPGPCSSCKYAEKPCPIKVACKRGCDCIQGHYRNSKGKCVRKAQCEKDGDKCRKDEQYYDCIPDCTNTCENYGIQDRILCPAICKPGCYCKKGLVKRKDGKCIKYEDCPDDVCEEGERPTKCASSCNTCKKKGDCEDDGDCRPGCDCRKGYYRNNEGKCIPEKLCPNKKCNHDEEYNECGTACPKTCKNYKEDTFCTLQCVPGCFCKKGLVRSDDGKCILPKHCPKDRCKDDEEFYQCIPDCLNTCKNYGKDVACPKICKRGCFCKRGLVATKEGKCVRPKDCPKDGDKCKKDEEYYKCIPDCTNTCENYGIRDRILCSAMCSEGCYCKKGLVKRKDGKCVRYEDCPADVCPEGERPKECASPCNTCEKKGNCDDDYCRPACDCKKGYYRNSEGQCIPEKQCPHKKCKHNEIYKTCGTVCFKTCDNFDVEIFCRDKCVKGCFCKDGLVRARDGKCIHPKDCPKKNVCPVNEAETDCVTPCKSCKYVESGCPIKVACRPGCDCIEDYYRDEDDKCVPRKECKKGNDNCKRDEQYYECIPSCTNTCENYGNRYRFDCAPSCTRGCYCKEGLVRRKDGKCIPYEKCPEDVCPKNEAPSNCVNNCNTCEEKSVCDDVCLEGCDCKKGYVRDAEGNCIAKSKCPRDKCKKWGEEFNECGTACPKTCDNLNKNIKCISECRKGCFCKAGLVRSHEGECIAPEDCPKEKCKKDEEFNDCIPCKDTCELYWQDVACKRPCVAGCFCKNGMIRRKDGKCVPPEDCKPGKCPENEEHSDCIVPCNDCKTRGNCAFLVCNKGCDCIKGYYRDSNERCIPQDKCPRDDCKEDEQYYECIPSCTNTCEAYGSTKPIHCPRMCVKGCFCKEGLVKRKDGKCVPYEECQIENCGEGEEYKKCGPACPETCSKFRIGVPCHQKCVKGCFCKKGLVRSSDNKCIPRKDCPGEKCKKNEEYLECGTACPKTCDNLNVKIRCVDKCVRGCFCKHGFVRSDEGECVKPEECPRGRCGEHEVYKECGTACPRTCNNLNVKMQCVDKCVKGCFCEDGFVRNKDGKCIKEKECPKNDCPKGEKYSDCGSACPKTCDNYDKDIACILVCKAGCFCEEGLVRNENGVCIPPSKCPRHHCGKNEYYDECGPACPAKCDDSHKKAACSTVCKKGCFCRPGFVRSHDGNCILPEDCPAKHCGKNEYYDECGPACPAKCNDSHKKAACPAVCKKGCFCRPGFVRSHDGNCILPEDCPTKKCKFLEKYYDCKPSCRHTCKTYGQKHGCLMQKCEPGCGCIEGLVRNDDGDCVLPKNCRSCPHKKSYD